MTHEQQDDGEQQIQRREYQADDGTVYQEWPNLCVGNEPTKGNAPFVLGCQSGLPTTYAETLDVVGERYVLEYCEEHKDQMQRFSDC